MKTVYDQKKLLGVTFQVGQVANLAGINLKGMRTTGFPGAEDSRERLAKWADEPLFERGTTFLGRVAKAMQDFSRRLATALAAEVSIEETQAWAEPGRGGSRTRSGG